MTYALTVRRLAPGSFEGFRAAFMGPLAAGPPPGWLAFDMVRNVDDPDEVICFGLFDGTADELRASARELGYEAQMHAIAPFVRGVGADGLYEVVEHLRAPGA
jgi:hypothetical protein